MPIHDWTRVDAGLFHHFHQDWTIRLCEALNDGVLPAGYVALTDQRVRGPIPDVLTLSRRVSREGETASGGLAVTEAPPRASFIEVADDTTFPSRANRIRVQLLHGEVVAVIEIVSPGNKSSVNALRTFVRKSVELLEQGINLLIVDLFPPSVRDPQGLHDVIWNEVSGRSFQPPVDKRLTAVAYQALPTLTAYVEPLAVGAVLPSLPLFLGEDEYIPAPLELSYKVSWAKFPDAFKPLLLEPPTTPES